MNAALRNKPVEQFGRFDPLGTPPDESVNDESSSEDPDSDGNGDHRRHRDDLFGGQDPCDFVSCDDDGNPVGLGGGRRGSRDSGNNGDSGSSRDTGDN
jgi:hypothetical protein